MILTPSISSYGLSEVLDQVNHYESEVIFDGVAPRITILRNFTVEGLEPFIKLPLYKFGLGATVRFGDYDNVVQDLLKIQAGQMEQPDLLVIALMLEPLDPSCKLPGWEAGRVFDQLRIIWQLALQLNCLVAVNTFLPPLYPDNSLTQRADGGDQNGQVGILNQSVRDFVASEPARVYLQDWERYLRRTGEAGLDYRYWYLARAPFKPQFFAAWGAEIAAILRALKGKNKKCLVLDCDNTLWGGVVGEEGLDGIKLDPHDYPGRAFYDFQATICRLAENGVMLAICSKNNEADVLEVLERHPHCLLKKRHLVGWRINWLNKANNIDELAVELNIGLDAMVFVDDNPVECELVNSQLPAVTVLQVPERLYEYPLLLQRQQLFDTLTLSAEDRQRTVLYQQERERQSSRLSFLNMEEYLASLSMTVTVRQIPTEEVARVAQLTQKTNQFNLTTRRYSEVEIAAFCEANDKAVLSLSAADRFGALGLVGVLIAKQMPGNAIFFDTFLMSCRALGRDLDKAFIARGIDLLLQRWPETAEWRAEYVSSDKNVQVANFWDRMGLETVSETSGIRTYCLKSVNNWLCVPNYITVLG